MVARASLCVLLFCLAAFAGDWEAIDDKGLAAIEALAVELVASIAPVSPIVGTR